MPRFSGIKHKPTAYPYKIVEYESGNKSIVRSDIAKIDITNADGSKDRPIQEASLGFHREESVRHLFEKPETIDFKRHKDKIKRFKYDKPAPAGRQLLPK